MSSLVSSDTRHPAAAPIRDTYRAGLALSEP